MLLFHVASAAPDTSRGAELSEAATRLHASALLPCRRGIMGLKEGQNKKDYKRAKYGKPAGRDGGGGWATKGGSRGGGGGNFPGGSKDGGIWKRCARPKGRAVNEPLSKSLVLIYSAVIRNSVNPTGTRNPVNPTGTCCACSSASFPTLTKSRLFFVTRSSRV